MHEYLPLFFADDLEIHARDYPNEPAYVQGERILTHAQLLVRARRLGSALFKARIRRQDRVGILAMNSIEYGEVIAATQWAGFILATVNFRLAPPEMLHIINDGAPKVLLFDVQYLAQIESLRPALISVELYVCIGGNAPWAADFDTFKGGG